MVVSVLPDHVTQAYNLAADFNSSLGLSPALASKSILKTASSCIDEAKARSLAALDELHKEYANNTTCDKTWRPQPSSPVRESSRFQADPLKNIIIRRMRSQVLLKRNVYNSKIISTGVINISSEKFRSQSPPPVYDPETGKRQNTREMRLRDELDIERRECIAESAKINPDVKIPSGFRPTQKEIKLYIPHRKYPGYNFVGLILGPRGSTQKRLELETGAKITIRGKGAVKEGGCIKKDSRGCMPAGWHEETHVHIIADSWDKVDAAAELGKPLLHYVEEERNIHRRSQMLQLAKINGTLPLNQLGSDVAGQLTLIKEAGSPLGQDETGIYKLPESMRLKVEHQYRRDVALTKRVRLDSPEDCFQRFIHSLGCETTVKNASKSSQIENCQNDSEIDTQPHFLKKKPASSPSYFSLNRVIGTPPPIVMPPGVEKSTLEARNSSSQTLP